MILSILVLAQLHIATPVEKLAPSVVFTTNAPARPPAFDAQEARVFNVTARQFTFGFSAEPQVNQGDSVTLNITSSDVDHGFFLELYMVQGVTIQRGKTQTVSFIANTPGTFTFFCSVFCGGGHGDMHGRFTVSAVAQAPPSISSFTPASAPTTGGTVVAITGTNFQNNATVRFGNAEALIAMVNSPTSITAITPAHAAGSVAVTVTNPDGQTATTTTQFTFTSSQPPERPRRRAVRR